MDTAVNSKTTLSSELAAAASILALSVMPALSANVPLQEMHYPADIAIASYNRTDPSGTIRSGLAVSDTPDFSIPTNWPNIVEGHQSVLFKQIRDGNLATVICYDLKDASITFRQDFDLGGPGYQKSMILKPSSPSPAEYRLLLPSWSQICLKMGAPDLYNYFSNPETGVGAQMLNDLVPHLNMSPDGSLEVSKVFAGFNYLIESTTNVLSTNWTPVTPVSTTNFAGETVKVALPKEHQQEFFRVKLTPSVP